MLKRLEDQQAFYDEVGRRIRDARKRRTPPLTQDELARSVGLTRTSITNVEQGRQKCLLHTLADIAAALHVEVGSLIPAFTTPAADLNDALRNRPTEEKEWIIATLHAANKGMTDNGT
jgi:DNA-binding XRE family transcriptional regulator